ncbi:MAG: hypothetical protein ABF743_02245 [Schleiferilactobacillus perolens]|uniref:hypothetical protein n=1 Tax=Schleiferilactobacillus perolens TaxID=100468 RepID=UPI0039E79091
MRRKHTYFLHFFALLLVFGGILFGVLQNNTVFADSVAPEWAKQAVVGTAYTADEFIGLPFSQQLKIVQTVHPEMDAGALMQAVNGSQFGQNNLAAPAAPLAVTPAATPGVTYLDIAPSDSGKAFAYFDTGSTAVPIIPAGVAFDGVAPGGLLPTKIAGDVYNLTSPARTIDRGSFTANELTGLSVSDFVWQASSDLKPADFKLSYSRGSGQTPPGLTLTVVNPAALPYNGKKVIFNVAKNQKTMQITFNLWRPEINRTPAVLPLGNGLSLRYMYGIYRSDRSTTHNNYDLTQLANHIDTPNFNLIKADSTAVNSLWEATSVFPSGSPARDSLTDFTNLYSSGGLAIGFARAPWLPWTGDDSIGTLPTDKYSPLIQFDDIKHIRMYPDSTNPKIIHLDYDGYIKNTYYLQMLGIKNGSLAVHVQSQLQPSSDGRQMMMGERVTNISGRDLTGIYFGRQFDVKIGTTDNAPLYYSAIAQDGPRQGKPQGVYFRSPTLESPYSMQFNFNSINGPDSWSGTHWMNSFGPTVATVPGKTSARINMYVTENGLNTYQSIMTDKDKHFPNGYPVFAGPEGKGDAGKADAKADEVIFGSGAATGSGVPPDDSAIIMKWSPSQVGSLKDGESFDMSFNSALNMGTAPTVRADSNYQHIPAGSSTAAIPGGVFDLNSNRATVYYQVDGTPVTTGNAANIANKKVLFNAQYATKPPHTDYLDFAGQITDPADLKLLTDGGQHTVYIYAIDTPDSTTVDDPYKQDVPLVSNVVQVAVNKPAKANIHLLDDTGQLLSLQNTAGAAVANPVVKTGIMPDPYNFNNFATGSPSILDTVADNLQGHPPLTVISGATRYDLDQSRLPGNGQGELRSSSDTIDIKYYYKKHAAGLIAITVPQIDFGEQPLTVLSGNYPIAKMTGELTVTNQTTTNKNFQVAAQATKPLTSSTGKILTDALGYQRTNGTIDSLAAGTIVYVNTDNSTTTFNISNTWWKTGSPQTGANQIAGPRLLITDANRSAISVGQYTGEITWSVTNGL